MSSGAKKALKKLPSLIARGEQVRRLASGRHGSATGWLVVTDRRLLFLPERYGRYRLDLSSEEILHVNSRPDEKDDSCCLVISTYDDHVEICDLPPELLDEVREHLATVGTGRPGLSGRWRGNPVTDEEGTEATVRSQSRDESPEPLRAPPVPVLTREPLRHEGDVVRRPDRRPMKQRRITILLYALAMLSLLGFVAELLLGGETPGHTGVATSDNQAPLTSTSAAAGEVPVLTLPSLVVPAPTTPTAPSTTVGAKRSGGGESGSGAVTTRTSPSMTTVAPLEGLVLPGEELLESPTGPAVEETTTTSEKKKKKGE